MAKQCSDCVFYDAPPDANPLCRINAPVPADITGGGSTAAVWPQVAPTDWCGQGYNPIDGWYVEIARPQGYGGLR